MPPPTEKQPAGSFERKAARAYGRGCFQVLLIQLAGLGVGLALLAWLLLFVGRRVLAGETNRAEILTATGAPVLVLVVVATIAVWWLVRRRGLKLDRVFAPWCAPGRQSGPAMRGWHGHAGKRRMDVWVSRGPKVEIYLECQARGRAWINRGGPVMRRINRLLNKEPIDSQPAGQLGVAVYSDDPDWVRGLLAHPGAQAAIGELMVEEAQSSTALNILPSCLHFMKVFLPIGSMDRQHAVRWVNALDRLAESVEGLDPPSVEQTTSHQEEWARVDRGGESLNRILLWIYGAGLFLLLALVLIFTFVLPLGGR